MREQSVSDYPEALAYAHVRIAVSSEAGVPGLEWMTAAHRHDQEEPSSHVHCLRVVATSETQHLRGVHRGLEVG